MTSKWHRQKSAQEKLWLSKVLAVYVSLSVNIFYDRTRRCDTHAVLSRSDFVQQLAKLSTTKTSRLHMPGPLCSESVGKQWVSRSMMTSSNANIFRVTGPLCGGFTGHRWIPQTKASDAELWCFLWSAPWINGYTNNRGTGDLRRQHAHYDVIVMTMTMTMTMTMNKFYCHALHKEYRISCRVIHRYWCNLRYSTSESHTWQKGLEAMAYVPQYLLYNVIWKGARKTKTKQWCRFCSSLYTSAL